MKVPQDQSDPITDDAIPRKGELVVVHHVTVFDPNGKGWRTTVRIQDGWVGSTLSHWSRGGSSVPHGIEKVVEDCRVAVTEALGFLEAF